MVIGMRRAAPAAVIALSTLGVAQAGTIIDFEDLTLGAAFEVGDSTTTAGVGIAFEDFVWSSGTPTGNGQAEVWDQLWAGGSGLDLESNNINIRFDFGADLTSLTLLYGEYGGNVNLDINGDFRNEQDFDVLDGATIGGVVVNIVDLGGSLRRMELDGPIETFAIGGQELWIDDVAYTIPGPGALAVAALGVLVAARRRRG